MVTEKDLYQNIEINCSSNSSSFLYLYDIENEAMISKRNNNRYKGYPITKVLKLINENKWKIIKPKIKLYELW